MVSPGWGHSEREQHCGWAVRLWPFSSLIFVLSVLSGNRIYPNSLTATRIYVTIKSINLGSDIFLKSSLRIFTAYWIFHHWFPWNLIFSKFEMGSLAPSPPLPSKLSILPTILGYVTTTFSGTYDRNVRIVFSHSISLILHIQSFHRPHCFNSAHSCHFNIFCLHSCSGHYLHRLLLDYCSCGLTTYWSN